MRTGDIVGNRGAQSLPCGRISQFHAVDLFLKILANSYALTLSTKVTLPSTENPVFTLEEAVFSQRPRYGVMKTCQQVFKQRSGCRILDISQFIISTISLILVLNCTLSQSMCTGKGIQMKWPFVQYI